MKIQFKITLICFTFVFFMACTKPEKVSEIPKIEFIDLPVKDTLDELSNPIRRASLIFKLTDGDGDIGFKPEDTLSPYNPGSPYYYNLYIDLYRKNNNEWQLISLQTPFYFRIPYIQPQGINKVLQCTIKVNLNFNLPTNIDCCNVVFYMYDRALHKSNIEHSGYRKIAP